MRSQFRAFFAAEGIERTRSNSCNRVHLASLSNATYLSAPCRGGRCQAARKTHHIHLITNAVEAVQRGRLGPALAPLIEEAFISETAGARSRPWNTFDYVFAHIDGITRENCLVIGDSLTSDIQGANNYGLACCWFNPKKAPKPESLRVDYEIRDLRELLRHCEIRKAPAPCRRFCVISLALIKIIAREVLVLCGVIPCQPVHARGGEVAAAPERVQGFVLLHLLAQGGEVTYLVRMPRGTLDHSAVVSL